MTPTTHDRIFAFGSIVLSVALLPALASAIHTPPLSALLTAGVLAAFAATYYDMRYRFAFAMVGLQSLLWTVIFIQSL